MPIGGGVSQRARVLSIIGLVLLVGLVGLAACSGSSDDNVEEDLPLPSPLTTKPYVATTLCRVKYHTDVIVLMSPTSGSAELKGVEDVVKELPARSAILVTSERAYDEARCLLTGHPGVVDTLIKELVPNQFRLDFGGDQDLISDANRRLEHLPGVAQVTGDPTEASSTTTTTASTAAPPGGAGAPVPTTPAPAAPQCEAQGIIIK